MIHVSMMRVSMMHVSLTMLHVCMMRLKFCDGQGDSWSRMYDARTCIYDAANFVPEGPTNKAILGVG